MYKLNLYLKRSRDSQTLWELITGRSCVLYLVKEVSREVVCVSSVRLARSVRAVREERHHRQRRHGARHQPHQDPAGDHVVSTPAAAPEAPPTSACSVPSVRVMAWVKG